MSCKYTDEEIKKILECCSKSKCEECAGCTKDICDYTNIRNETIDEFANELVSRIVHNEEIINRDSGHITAEINKLAKEMKEVDE